jgi:class 3 adenylate cyclase
MSYWTELRLPTERELVVGLYDLTAYTAYCLQTPPGQALDLMTRYCAMSADIIHGAGGWFVKAIGDAGLFAFPPELADAAVSAVLKLQDTGDPWLARENYNGRVRTVMHVGPVAIGRIGARGREQLDIIGRTVNIVGGMRTEGYLAITPELFRRLSGEGRRHFKKHTPPVSYIGARDPRPKPRR